MCNKRHGSRNEPGDREGDDLDSYDDVELSDSQSVVSPALSNQSHASLIGFPERERERLMYARTSDRIV